MRRTAIACLLVLSACRPSARRAAPLDDATYAAVLTDLMRIELARRARPPVPTPAPVPGRLSTDTSWKVARAEDSLRTARRDSVARADVLTRHGVTVAQLEATARALSKAPARARAVWDSVTRRASGPRQPS